MVGLRLSGAQIGCGFQLQTPWFVGLLAGVFVILGLWLYGWVEFGMALSGIGQHLTEGHSVAPSSSPGALAGSCCDSCTALPWQGRWAGTLTQPWWITLTYFRRWFWPCPPMPYLRFVWTPANRLPRPGH